MRRSIGPKAALIAACMLLAHAQSAGAQALQKIRVTVPQIGAVFYPLYYGEEQGYFAREGLTVEVISTNGDGPDVDAVIAGSVQFALTTPNRLFTAFEQGKKLKAIMTVAKRMSNECILSKAVADKAGITVDAPIEKKMAALHGLTVAGTRPGAFTYVLMEIYLRRAGLVPQKDVQVIGLGASSALLAALENNQIAAFCSSSPTTELERSRGKAIAITDNVNGTDSAFSDFMYELIYANPDLLAREPQTARKFLRALQLAVDGVIDTPTAQLLPGLKTHFGGVPDEVMVEGFENVKKVFSRDGRTTRTGVENAGKFMLETGSIKHAATFDDIATNEYLPQ